MTTTPTIEQNPKPIPTATSTASKASTTKKKKVKKKKTSAKKSNAANAAALNTAARTQYQKLLKQREAKLHDAAWLSTVPPPTFASISTKIESPSFLEHDVEIVNKALENNGLTMEDVTAEGFACLLEEARRYAMGLMTDAGDYAVHSHISDNITPADLMLAKEMQDDMDVGNMEALARIAQETNRRMLPPIPDNCYNGIVLPSTEYTLLGRSFDVICRKDEPIRKETNETSVQKIDEKSIPIPSYGARRGLKQVQISLQSSAGSNSNVAANASDAMEIS